MGTTPIANPPYIPPGQRASDNFKSGALSSGWTTVSGLSASVVSGGVAQSPSVGTSAGQIFTGIAWPADQISEVHAGTFVNEVGTTLIMFVRLTNTGGNYAGYQLNFSDGTATIYRIDSGTSTSLATAGSVPITNGDVLTFAAQGNVLFFYRNFKVYAYAVDSTYQTGSPGFGQNPANATSHMQVAYWRGSDGVSQDGIWKKQKVVIPLTTADVASSGLGVFQFTDILRGPAVLLSGTVYKVWFCGGGNTGGVSTYYAESADGLTWTRRGSAVMSRAIGWIVDNGAGTYYAGTQPPTAVGVSNVDLYKSTDGGITWSLDTANILAKGGTGAWDEHDIYPTCAPLLVSGTWYWLYTGLSNADATSLNFKMGLATATSLAGPWTKSASNPLVANASPGSPILSAGGKYYVWIAAGPSAPMQSGTASAWDPQQTYRIESTDLVTWTNRTPSLRNTEPCSSLNSVTGVTAPYFTIDIGGRAHMYYVAGPRDSSGPQDYQIGVAIAPSPMATIATGKEDACVEIATADFSGGTGNLPTVDPRFSTVTGRPNVQIVAGNKAEPTTTSAWNQAVFNGGTAPVLPRNQYVEVTIATLAASSYIGMILRGGSAAQNWYEALLLGPTGSINNIGIYVNTGGTQTQLGPFATCTPQVGDVWRFAVIGNVLQLSQNGHLVLQVEDYNATFPSGSPGLEFYTGTITNAQASHWACGETLVTGQSITG